MQICRKNAVYLWTLVEPKYRQLFSYANHLLDGQGSMEIVGIGDVTARLLHCLEGRLTRSYQNSVFVCT